MHLRHSSPSLVTGAEHWRRCRIGDGRGHSHRYPDDPTVQSVDTRPAGQNERTDAVEGAASIRANESGESREVTFRLDAGEEQRIEGVDLLERAVTLAVRIDGEAFRHVPGSGGLIVVTVTADGVAFDELVT